MNPVKKLKQVVRDHPVKSIAASTVVGATAGVLGVAYILGATKDARMILAVDEWSKQITATGASFLYLNADKTKALLQTAEGLFEFDPTTLPVQ